jgi:hypothetical protein
MNLNAQVFAPEDAVWYYNYDPDITLDDGYPKVDFLGDTYGRLALPLCRTKIIVRWHLEILN